jgi:Ca-activated chloride channel family protein
MKYLKTYLFCALLIFATISPLRANLATAQKPDPKQKDDKTKKPAPAEQEDQAVKLGAALVTVPFSVTDKKNAYVNDLTKNDIDVLEDNKPQQIFSFEKQTDLPITIAMLIDISGSEEFKLPDEKAAGERFFAKVLRPNKDLGAVITFESEAVLVQDLTSDVQKLQQALRKVKTSVVSTSGRVRGTPPIVNSNVGSTALYDAVYSVSADLLGREAGRRVIILITDGDDTSSKLRMHEAIERAWRSEVIIYAIGIGDSAFAGVDKGGLKKITGETGGRAFFPHLGHDELDTAFAQIDEDLRQQYIMAYSPSNDAKDGSFRAIQVKMKNRKDVTVRHRRGYFAPKIKES